MANKTIRILSRDSFLALAQTIQISDYLMKEGYAVEVKALKTSGDIKLDAPLYKVSEISGDNSKEGKAYFTKELEDGLLRNDGDIAVHSLKDLPTELPKGLAFCTPVMPVESSDSIVCKEPLPESPEEQRKYFTGKVIGSSSLRRIALVNRWFPKVKLLSVRGNVVTRLEKLLNHDEPHALILATAGLKRLHAFYKYWGKNRILWEKKLESTITARLDKDYERLNIIFSRNLYFYEMDPDKFLPAVSQGVLGIESRESEAAAIAKIFNSAVMDPSLTSRIELERNLLSKLEAGCHIPYGNKVELTQLANKSFFKINSFFARNYSPDFSSEVEGQSLDIFNTTRLLSLSYTDSQSEQLVNEIKGKRNDVILCGLENDDFLEILRDAGFSAWHIPLIESVSVSPREQLGNDYSCAIVTSKNCVDHFPDKLPRIKNWIAVGEKTATHLRNKKGINNIKVPAKNDGISAAELALELNSGDHKFLWFGALNGKKDGINLLKDHGAEVTVYEGYQTRPLEIKMPAEINDKAGMIFKNAWWVFTSPSSAESYFQQNLYNPAHLIAVIGETTANSFLNRDIVPNMIASRSDLKVMAEEIAGINTSQDWKLTRWTF